MTVRNTEKHPRMENELVSLYRLSARSYIRLFLFYSFTSYRIEQHLSLVCGKPDSRSILPVNI